VIHLDEDVGAESGILAGTNADLVKGIQSHIHDNISVLTNFLAQGQGNETHTPADLRRQTESQITLDKILISEAGSAEAARNPAVEQLTHIHRTILQIASSLGAPVASS
jgi:hypothetical protein